MFEEFKREVVKACSAPMPQPEYLPKHTLNRLKDEAVRQALRQQPIVRTLRREAQRLQVKQ